MLKNIRLHIKKDEQKQAELDETLAKQILKTHSSNINAFQRNIPSLITYVKNTDLANYSIFANKYGKNNIVDYGMGRTFYGFHPEEEVLEQLFRIEQHCPEIVFKKQILDNVDDSDTALSIEELQSVKLRNQQPPMPYEIDCLVVLGCGLGIHLSHLLKNHKIKNLLIYEPELQYFQCSVMTTSWQDIFILAKEHDTSIFLQLEKDGRDLLQDINELIEHSTISSFHLYKHYNHQVFDSLHKDLSERSWSEIENSGFKLKSKESYLDYLPSWTPNINLSTHSLLMAPNDKLTKNLNTFKQFFPKIYEEYKDYTPKKWQPIINQEGEVNIIKIDTLHSWYGASPKHDCILNFENFNEQPNKDGLVLGYKGNKLAHYIHYQFVKETEELLKQAEEEVGALPDKVPSIIMFGLGVGYQLEKLLDEHTVEKLFICEPNPDFFYASLFAIDWQKIFETVEKSDSRIYLNIGDDGTNLFRDLLSQFYAIGPYILNSTYFYQSYYNASLNSAINQLREQLQVVISMGEYFDHAYYGIAHTKEGMKRKIPVLAANPASKLNYDDKEVPIFIVGNGPSLDSSIDAIKEWQGQAIVVSCGTALQALHRHDITPDFHAEIEQNRSTFDWAVLIGDLDYLKNITLISCNGIHPDTCDLYKDVMIAFKEGESSTVSALNVLGRENFATLLNAFPTVSNFAIDLFSTIGFTSIYLIGVDLGFVDVKHHHSKSSGYYQEDGKETYDFTKSANTSLIVPGNFRPKVNTKHEFKVSRQVIEQVTSAKPKTQEFYNCSDGAKIQGTLPIRPDELLILATELQKSHAIEKLNTTIFSTKNIGKYSENFEKMFFQDLLIQELYAFETLLKKEVTNKEDIEKIIKKQKEMLFASYKNGKSLLFYYFYGTVNYANAMLSKLLSACSNHSIQPLQEAVSIWRNNFNKIKVLVMFDEDFFDTSSFQKYQRELLKSREIADNKSFLIVTDSMAFKESIEKFEWLNSLNLANVTFCNETSLSQIENQEYDYVINYFHNDEELSENYLHERSLGSEANIFITNESVAKIRKINVPTNVTLMPLIVSPYQEQNCIISDIVHVARSAVHVCLSNHKAPMVLLTYSACAQTDYLKFVPEMNSIAPSDSVFGFTNHCAVYYTKQKNAALVSDRGTRGTLILKPIQKNELICAVLDPENFYSTQHTHRKMLVGINSGDKFAGCEHLIQS